MPETTFTLNGNPITASFDAGMDFLEVLREECGVLSPKNGCAPEGACGCCAILVDGQPVLPCLRKPEHMAGRDVVTVEGLADDLRRVLSEAFQLEGGVQCGFCIPGIAIRAAGLLQHGRGLDRDEIAKALDGHLCRCTGYARIIDAIQTAAEAWCDHKERDHKELPHNEPRRHFYFGEQYGFSRAASQNGKHANGVVRPQRVTSVSNRRSAKSLSSMICVCRACCTARPC